MSTSLTRDQRRSREADIEDAIMAQPEVLGFPMALAMRNFRVADTSGAVDVCLIPQSGPFRVVLGEAKAASAPDAGSKVVGQLLMYYAGALTLGSHGINALGEFAKQFEVEAKRIERTSPQKVFQNLTGVCYPNAHCFELLKKGKRVSPEEVALFIAIDNEPNHVLKPLLQMLLDHHGIAIGLVLVREGKIEVLVPVVR